MSRCPRLPQSPSSDPRKGSSRDGRGDTRSTRWPWWRPAPRAARASPTLRPPLSLLLLLRFRGPHQALRYDPFQDDLHVHRVVLEQRRGRIDRQVGVLIEQAFRERLKPQVSLLDRRVAQLVPVRVLDAAEVRVDVPSIGDLLDLRKDVVEIFRALEQSEAARVHVREIQDREDPFRVLDEGQELVEAADDFGAAARLDPQPRADLAFLVRVTDEAQVLRDAVHRFFRLQFAEHPEVRHDNRRAHRGREHAAPDDALHALLRQAVRVRQVHVVRRVQRELDVHFPGEVSQFLEFAVVPRDPRREAVEDVPFLDLGLERGDQDLLAVLLPADLDDELRGNLPRGPTDVLVTRVPFVQVHSDELDFHGREAEVVDVLDAVPQRPPFAGQRDSRRPKTDHEPTPDEEADTRLLFWPA